MNNRPSPRPAIFSYKTVIAAMLAVLLALLMLIDFVLIHQQRQEYMHALEEQMVHQLNVAATFMVEPLLKYQFADVEQFMQQWFDSYDEIQLFEATYSEASSALLPVHSSSPGRKRSSSMTNISLP